MKRRKQTWLVFVLIFTILLITACGKTEKPIAEEPLAEEPLAEVEVDTWKSWSGTITIWDGPRWTDENENQYNWLEVKKAEFESMYPNVTIKIVKTPWKEMGEKLSVAVAGRAWPDVVSVDQGKGGIDRNLVSQGVIEEMDEFLTEEVADYYPNALGAYTVDGKIYGIPSLMSIHAMLINLDIFEEKGVEPPKDGRWTYDEFVEKMEDLTGDGVYGFSTYVLPGYYEAWPFLLMDGAYPLNEDYTEYTFDSPEAISGLQKFLDLKFKYEVSPEEMGGADVGGTWTAWASSEQRTVAVEPWATWAIAAAHGEKWNTNMMVVEYPIGKTGKPVSISGVGGWIMFKQIDEDKKIMVAEFMKYITSTEDQFLTAQKYGVFPARFSAAELNPYVDNPEMQQAQKLTENAVMLPTHPSWARIDEAIQRELQLATNGEKTAEQALKDARSVVEEILNE